MKPDSKGGVVKRFGKATVRGVSAAGRFWRWSLIGDVSGEVQRAKRVYSMLRDMLLRPAGASRHETFEQAVTRLALTSEDLTLQERALRRRDKVFVCTSVAAFCLIVVSPMSPRPLSQFAISVSLFAMCVCKSLVCRYRVAQIQNRELFSFRTWLLRRH
ncbi:hypothetical protein CEE58_15765 [Stenotrophomonas maltophilia]|nr:hypothetical protein CEE58_15765 [Stenotrophomonas maltophilia]